MINYDSFNFLYKRMIHEISENNPHKALEYNQLIYELYFINYRYSQNSQDKQYCVERMDILMKQQDVICSELFLKRK